MENTTYIQFKNKLIIEKRNLNIYQHNDKGIHMISYGSSVRIPLQTIVQNDYINLSVAVGSGFMERQSIVELPSWLNYEFLSEGKFAASNAGDRIILKIPAGRPEWKLKLTLPSINHRPGEGLVIISDESDD